jgi:hypothetical protein
MKNIIPHHVYLLKNILKHCIVKTFQLCVVSLRTTLLLPIFPTCLGMPYNQTLSVVVPMQMQNEISSLALHIQYTLFFMEGKLSSKANTVKPLFIVFVGGLKKKQWIRENNRCRSHSWNRICSETTEIERWIQENELSGNDR